MKKVTLFILVIVLVQIVGASISLGDTSTEELAELLNKYVDWHWNAHSYSGKMESADLSKTDLNDPSKVCFPSYAEGYSFDGIVDCYYVEGNYEINLPTSVEEVDPLVQNLLFYGQYVTKVFYQSVIYNLDLHNEIATNNGLNYVIAEPDIWITDKENYTLVPFFFEATSIGEIVADQVYLLIFVTVEVQDGTHISQIWILSEEKIIQDYLTKVEIIPERSHFEELLSDWIVRNSEDYEEERNGIVTMSRSINVRKEPNLNSTIVYKAKSGEVFSCVGEVGGEWYKVILPDEAIGYVGIKTAEYESSSIGKVKITSDSTVNVRKEPTTDSAVVYKAKPGEEFPCTAQAIENRWYMITLPDGSIGFVSPKLAEFVGK